MSNTLEEIVSEFRNLDDPGLRADLLIEYGESFTRVPEAVAKSPYPKENLVPGCESEAYVFYNKDSGLHFAVENPQGVSAMAMARILQESINGENPPKANEICPEIVYELFGKGISMGKGQGLMNMVLAVQSLIK